jgi:hemin uptake protein HemP
MQSGGKVDRSQRGLDVEPVPPSIEPKTAGAIEWNTEQLFGTAHEVSIRHEGHLYRLRRTKLGKLILTK